MTKSALPFVRPPAAPQPRTQKPLTDTVIRKATPKAVAWKLAAGSGLYVLIQPSGVKLWRFDYRFGGKRKTLALGAYPTVTLKAARTKLADAKRELDAGKDPGWTRKVSKRQTRVAHASTFETLGKEWLAQQKAVRRPSTITRNTSVLEKYLWPTLGPQPISLIQPPDVLDVLRTIEAKGFHETAHRTKHLCGLIFRYAIATGRAISDPTRDLRGALQPVRQTAHAALLEPIAIGRLLQAIDTYPGFPVTRWALQLAPLVFVRPGELRRAEWREIDLGNAVWRIPAAKIKTNTPHLVPLSRQAITILECVKAYTRGGRYVFPNARHPERPMSDMALTGALRTLGYTPEQMTPHGFRAMARTLLDEVLHFRAEVIELQLAHTVPGALGSTYNRSQWLAERAAMLQRWADYLDELRALQ